MFKQIFNEEAQRFIPDARIGETPCKGSIQTVRPSYDFFGNCFEVSCEC